MTQACVTKTDNSDIMPERENFEDFCLFTLCAFSGHKTFYFSFHLVFIYLLVFYCLLVFFSYVLIAK